MQAQKTLTWILIIGMFGLFSSISAQHRQLHLSQTPTATRLETNSDSGFSVRFNTGEVRLETVQTMGGTFSRLAIEGYGFSSRVGEPELPVISKLIAVPLGAQVSFELVSKQERLLGARDSGLQHPLVPAQPSLFKNQDPALVPFEKNTSSYTRDGFTDNELFYLEEVGMMGV